MTDSSTHCSKPACHGDLKTVFPMGTDGLRHTPPDCMACEHKTACLRQAVTYPTGRTVQEESIKRAYNAGMIGFVERWSRKKKLNQNCPNTTSPRRPWRKWFKKGPAKGADI